MTPSRHSQRQRIKRCQFHRPLGKFECLGLGFRLEQHRTRQRAHGQLPCRQFFRLFAAGSLGLGVAQHALKLRRDALSDALFEGERVIGLAIPGIGPQTARGCGVQQCDDDPRLTGFIRLDSAMHVITRIRRRTDDDRTPARQGHREFLG